ncbi:MAG: 4-(cytidine 5'-diphospho)-2-C-methyl-D-erythritol kinase [Solirubrobacterales bacterium]|nr:4-(cytidine 5'-diphospho)-2-C-methyl-D-erythritol kinase [Solirubrobacterales bacterium]MCB8914652.1 4-(cytidine 5'-diphospho)-2-C-methyl-D-erythritol kinase [Thermoleophilales bacterium]
MTELDLPLELAAPAKLNLCLYLGPRRKDGLHELTSIFEPLTLGDNITVTEGGPDALVDQVICPGITGENLVAKAIRMMRSEGWSPPLLKVEIEKRIPVQAGLGGGSADAAAILRLGVGDVDDLAGLALLLGADVPSQLNPKPLLVEGVGQKLTTLPAPAEHWVVLLPFETGLSTRAVFDEADRMKLGRSQAEIDEISGRLWAVATNAVSPLAYPALLVNDLEPAAISLKPEIGLARERLKSAGAVFTGMTGTGPTVFGLFPDRESAGSAAAGMGRDAILCQGGVAEPPAG